MQIVLLILVTVALPIAWIVADFRGRPATRRVLGLVTLLWSFAIATLVGGLQQFNANSYFGFATKDLLKASVGQLRAGNNSAVLREWERADEQFNPTYENRGRYRQIVDQAIEGMKKP